MENIIKRISLLCDNEDIKITMLERLIGASKGVLSRALANETDIQSKWLIKIVENYPHYNTEWLLTGKGEMLKTKKNKNTGNLIPLYEDVATIGGSNMVADTGTSNNAPITIDSGDWFHGATAAIRHYGDSMVEYPSGCILAIRELFNKDEVVPGRKYVIETSEIRVTKKLICFDDDTFMCYSTNIETYPDGTLIHQPFKIRKKDIRHIAIVLGSVNKEESTGKVQLL